MNDTATQFKPGIYRDMSFGDYLEIEAISGSVLRELYSSSPAHVHYGHHEVTAAMNNGSAMHCILLEPHKFDSRYYLKPTLDIKDKNGESYKRPEQTNEGKARLARIAAENEGKCCIAPHDHANMLRAGAKLLNNAIAAPMIKDSEKEVSIFWEEEFGLCKARFDMLGNGFIADLKTTACAHPEEFTWNIKPKRKGLNYWIQAAWYYMGAKSVGLNVSEFNFFALELEEPFGNSIHVLDAADLNESRSRVYELAKRWSEHQSAGVYPGYPVMRNAITLWEHEE